MSDIGQLMTKATAIRAAFQAMSCLDTRSDDFARAVILLALNSRSPEPVQDAELTEILDRVTDIVLECVAVGLAFRGLVALGTQDGELVFKTRASGVSTP